MSRPVVAFRATARCRGFARIGAHFLKCFWNEEEYSPSDVETLGGGRHTQRRRWLALIATVSIGYSDASRLAYPEDEAQPDDETDHNRFPGDLMRSSNEMEFSGIM
jgi:hypothetical protein